MNRFLIIFLIIILFVLAVGGYWEYEEKQEQITLEENKISCLEGVKLENESYWELINMGFILPIRDDFWLFKMCYNAGINIFDLPEYREIIVVKSDDNWIEQKKERIKTIDNMIIQIKELQEKLKQ